MSATPKQLRIREVTEAIERYVKAEIARQIYDYANGPFRAEILDRDEALEHLNTTLENNL